MTITPNNDIDLLVSQNCSQVFPSVFLREITGNNLGWQSLILETAEKINNEIEKLDLLTQNNGLFCIVSSREKIGGLRISYDFSFSKTREIRNLLLNFETFKTLDSICIDAQLKSYKICKLCGQPGEIQRYWPIVELVDFSPYSVFCEYHWYEEALVREKEKIFGMENWKQRKLIRKWALSKPLDKFKNKEE